MVQAIRDSIVLPNVGPKFVKVWAPLILTFFCFIVVANGIGLIPIFEVIGLLDHTVLHTSDDSLLNRVIHGGATATANYNVTAALATITFVAIIVAGSRAHGFIQHWKNLVPHGLPMFVYVILIPIELMGMLVKPFALTMRLAANMTGGHIAILAILSFVFLFQRAVSERARRDGCRGCALGAIGRRYLGVGDRRDLGPGVCVYSADCCLHRYGYQRAPLERDERRLPEWNPCISLAPRSVWVSP